MPRLSQACLLGYTPSPQQAFQGDAAHQAQRRTWLTPNDSPGTWYTRRDYWSWTIRPFHRTVFTAHTWSALPIAVPVLLEVRVAVSRAAVAAAASAVAGWPGRRGVQRSGMGVSRNRHGGVNEGLKTRSET